MNVDIVYSVNPKSASQETAVIVQSLACWCKCTILAFFLLFKHNLKIWVIWTKHLHHQSKISLYLPLNFSHKLVCHVLDYHLSGFEINDFTVSEGSSTSSTPPCLSTVKQWIITPPHPWAWSYCIPSPLWVYSPYFLFPQQGLISPLHFVLWNFSCLCGDARCCRTIQPLTPSISITTATLRELHSPPTPHFDQWRGKAIMQVAHENREKVKEHLNLYIKRGGRAHVRSQFH